MSLYKKYTEKPFSVLVIDTIFVSDNLLSFRQNLLETILKLITTIGDKIRVEKLQYYINRKAAKISALSSNKSDKNEYLTEEKILPPYQNRVLEKAKFTYLKKKQQKNKQKQQHCKGKNKSMPKKF